MHWRVRIYKSSFKNGKLECGLVRLIFCLFAPSGLPEMQSSGGFPVCVPELWGHTEELKRDHLYLEPATAFRHPLALVHRSTDLFQSVQEWHSAAEAALLCGNQLFLILFPCLLIWDCFGTWCHVSFVVHLKSSCARFRLSVFRIHSWFWLPCTRLLNHVGKLENSFCSHCQHLV